MTEFVIELIRLRGDERWEDWGPDWRGEVERLGRLSPKERSGWELLDHFRQQKVSGTQLDWGTLVFPVGKDDLVALYPNIGRIEGESPATAHIADLPEDDEYALAVIEC